MRRAHVASAYAVCVVGVVLFACGDLRISLGDDGPADSAPDTPPSDAPIADARGEAARDADADADAMPIRMCPPGSVFVSVKPVAGLETIDVWSARLSPDEATVYLTIPAAPGTATEFDLYTAGRVAKTSAFGAPTKLSISTSTDDYWPTVSPDGKIMFFESGLRLDGAVSSSRIWFASRATVPGNFARTILDYFASVPETVTEAAPYLAASGTKLYWSSIGRAGSTTLDIWAADMTAAGVVVTPSRVDVSTDRDDSYPVVTDDDAELFFGHDSLTGTDDIYVSVRAPGAAGFTATTPVGAAINTTDAEWSSWVSPDACRLYFIRKKETADQARLFVAERSKP